MDDEVDREHALYAIGKSFIELQKNKNDNLVVIQNKLGENWKALRFQNLVRLGSDIENTGLAALSRATLVGALLYQKEKMIKD